MKNNKLCYSVIALTMCAVVMTGCCGNNDDSNVEKTAEIMTSHDYGYQQLCKAIESTYKEIESPISWDKNYSYVDEQRDGNVFGFYNPIDGHDYYVITENGYVYDMTVSSTKAEVICHDGNYAPDNVRSIWGVDSQNEECYAVWYVR